MRKLINGKVVNIDNIELFEMAKAGLARGAVTVSSTEALPDENSYSDSIAKVIKMYNVFYKSMPYPLYAIEHDIKYATLGCFLKHTESGSNQMMFLDNGLYVVTDVQSMTAIHIVNNSWSVEHIDAIKRDNVDIENYKEHPAYKEYSWMLQKVLKMDNRDNYYSRFMPEFIRACNNDPMIIRWELQNMLNFNRVPDELSIADNTLIKIDSNEEFTMDIYASGHIQCRNGNTRWDTTGIGIQTHGYDNIVKYDYTLYKKTAGNSKMQKASAEWAANLFGALYKIKCIRYTDKFPMYRGVVLGNTVVIELYGSVYAIDKNGSKEIANNASIYSAHSSDAYIKRATDEDGVTKVAIYKYSVSEKRTKICSIDYHGGNV